MTHKTLQNQHYKCNDKSAAIRSNTHNTYGSGNVHRGLTKSEGSSLLPMIHITAILTVYFNFTLHNKHTSEVVQ